MLAGAVKSQPQGAPAVQCRARLHLGKVGAVGLGERAAARKGQQMSAVAVPGWPGCS